MSSQINATFEIASWDEQPIDEKPDLAKLTEVLATKTYSGDIDGTSVTKSAMAYGTDGTATFVGIERLDGTIGGRSGSVVLQHVGRFVDGSADAALTVISGTGELEGVSGSGVFKADPNGAITLELT